MKVFRRQKMRHGHDSFKAIPGTEIADQLNIPQGIGTLPIVSVSPQFIQTSLSRGYGTVSIWNPVQSSMKTMKPSRYCSESLTLFIYWPYQAGSIAAERSLEAAWDPPVAHASNVDEGSPHSLVESPASVPTVSIPPRTRSASLDMGLSVTPQVHVRASSSAEVSAPLPHRFLPWAKPRTPFPRPSSIAPHSMASIFQQSNTSRFSTILNSRNQETVVIDISDEEDEGDETDQNLLLCPLDIGNDHDSDDGTSAPSTSAVDDPSDTRVVTCAFRTCRSTSDQYGGADISSRPPTM